MKYFALLALLFFCQPSFAQVYFGLKLGAGTTSITDQQLDILDQGGLKRFGVAMKEADYSIHGGIVLQARAGKVFLIQPEILLQSNTLDYRVEDFANPGSSPKLLSEKYQSLNIPLLLGFKAGPLRIQAGPQGHVFLSSRTDLSALEGYKEDFKQTTFSWLAGAGIDVWRTLMFDVRYEGSLTQLGDHLNFFGQSYPFESRSSRLLISVGLLFGKKK